MNRFKEVIIPFSLCISLFKVGAFIWTTASRELAGTYNKSAFLGIKSHVVLLESSKYPLEMLRVKCVCTRLYYHIFHVHFKIFPYLFSKYFAHHSLVRCSDVLQLEWHDIVLAISLLNHEHDFYPVESKHWYLVIPKVRVHEIKQNINR